MISKLLIHMPIDGPHRYLELLCQIRGCLPFLGHVSNFLDLVRRQLIVALRTFLEFVQIVHGDQPIPADLDCRQPSMVNQGKYALGGDA